MEVKHLGIGIHGKKFSGKSEVSNLIEKFIFEWKQNLLPQDNLHFLAVRQLAFADKVKYIAKNLMPSESLKKEILHVTSEKKEIELQLLSRSPREIWKIVGEMGRAIHPDLWVWNIEETVKNYIANPTQEISWWSVLHRSPKSLQYTDLTVGQANFVFLIDDVRRANEYQALKNRDFLLFRVIGKNDSNDQHPTETDLDQLTDDHFHAIIHNEEKNLEYLTSQVREIFQDLIGPKLNQMIGC